jgi:uncharacterized protein YdeI (YjbR/CyaY-like superfamily)
MKNIEAKNRLAWRSWLKKNHRNASEIWLIFYKKHTSKPSVSYDEAVEEALCFGWVDSIVRTIDADRYEQKFTPRKPTSEWAASNIERAKKMIAARKMTAAGKAVFAGHEQRIAVPLPTALPADLAQRFRKAKRAWKNFERFPPGHQRMAIGWVASAKREETQRNRLDQLIATSARNERLKFI